MFWCVNVESNMMRYYLYTINIIFWTSHFGDPEIKFVVKIGYFHNKMMIWWFIGVVPSLTTLYILSLCIDLKKKMTLLFTFMNRKYHCTWQYIKINELNLYKLMYKKLNAYVGSVWSLIHVEQVKRCEASSIVLSYTFFREKMIWIS